MSFLSEIRERRIVPFLGSYIVAGFLALEAVDQLVGHEFVPEIFYTVTLILYALGIPATAVVAFFHGAKGAQTMPRAEKVALTVIGVIAVAWSGMAIRNHVEQQRIAQLAAEGELDLRRVAVLYFTDASSGQQLGHVADGFTESLIDNLAHVRELDVISKNGVGQYRGAEVSVDSIARSLEAGTVIQGSVDQSAGQLRVSLRLMDGSSGVDIERTSFEMPADELLTARDSVAGEASRILRVWLGEEFRVRQQRAGTADAAAWTLVQRAERQRKNAEDYLLEGDADGVYDSFDRADSLFAEAAALDDGWVEPVVGRGLVAYRLSRIAGDLEEAADEAARGLRYANAALSIDPNDAAALELRGTLRYWSWLLHVAADPVEHDEMLVNAKADLERSVEIDPTRAGAYSTLSHLYYQTEDLTSVVLSARRAYEEDAYLAVAADVLWRLVQGSYDLGQAQPAKRWCDVGSQRFSEDFRFVFCQLMVMTTPAAEPNIDRAWQLQQELEATAPEFRQEFEQRRGRMIVGAIIARAGLPDSARAVLDRTRASVDPDLDPEGDLLVIEAFARTQVGDQDEAIDLLKLYAAAQHGFARGDDLHWWWRELAGHPRFQEIETAGQ